MKQARTNARISLQLMTIWGGPLLVFVLLAWRQTTLILDKAVNIIFWDQWDTWGGYFINKTDWELFNVQHGPHRQGLGSILSRYLAEISHYDTRWEAHAISILLISSTILAFWLAKRLNINEGWGLLSIPLVVLNIRQYEHFVGASNMSHSGIPLLMTLGAALCLMDTNPHRRTWCLAFLAVMLIFTGFGLFAGALLTIILGRTLLDRPEDKYEYVSKVLALLLVVFGWLQFANGYAFAPAVPNFKFPHDRPLEYLWYVAMMFSSFMGYVKMGGKELFLGTTLFLLICATCLYHGLHTLRGTANWRTSSAPIFLLSAATLLFTINTAIGRVSIGIEHSATSSRYVTLMIPGMLALIIQTLQLPIAKANKRTFSAVICVVIGLGTILISKDDERIIDWYSNGKLKWRESYLIHRDKELADKEANFPIFPAPLPHRLKYLEEHKLNLFAE